MRVLRLLVVGCVFGLSVLAIGFVCADRLAHPVVPPLPALARLAPPREPVATGSIAQAPPPVAAKPKATDGFDTERLNALMRGDPLSGRR